MFCCLLSLPCTIVPRSAAHVLVTELQELKLINVEFVDVLCTG